jgi:putative (di)nucleoside polyphosphate hydrolase
MSASSTGLYRPCVGIALFNRDNHVFLGERIDTPGAWQMPQGGIDDDETIEQAAFRELAEEIGTNKAKIIRVADTKIRYELPPDMREKLWQGRFIGQEQTWVAMRFLGQDHEIRLEAHKPPEFNDWKWSPLEETLDLIVPFKRETYTKVIEIFADIAAR